MSDAVTAPTTDSAAAPADVRPGPSLQGVVRVMAQALVDHPTEVEVEEFDEDGSIVVELRVAQDDIGKVIGKAGRTAEAMRVVLQSASPKVGRRIHLDIID